MLSNTSGSFSEGAAWQGGEITEERINEKDKSDRTPVEILFLSNLIESKRVLVLIEACKLLWEKSVDFHCTIAGENGDTTKSDVNKVIFSGVLDSFITVSNAKYGDEKAAALSNADIFVLTTFYPNECMPLVLLEAMQYSLTVVSTFEGAIPDAVEDDITGFFVPQKNASALADKLETLIKDPELCLKMGKAGRAKYESEFTLEIFEKRMKEILEEVVRSEA